jgi:hypothetical protein
MTSDSDRIAWVQHAANVVLGAAFKVPVPQLPNVNAKTFGRFPGPAEEHCATGTRTRCQARQFKAGTIAPRPTYAKRRLKGHGVWNHVRAIVGAWVY